MLQFHVQTLEGRAYVEGVELRCPRWPTIEDSIVVTIIRMEFGYVLAALAQKPVVDVTNDELINELFSRDRSFKC